jgi:threonine synthase
MFATHLVCLGCGSIFPVKLVYNCPRCEGILDVKYDYERIAEKGIFSHLDKGIWRFRKILPIEDTSEFVSLGEGNTPLLEDQKVGEEIGLKKLYLKDETRNPTGSFKDRPISVAISQAKKEKKRVIIISSSGNAAAAAAAYAARSGIKCIVVAPRSSPESKLLQILAYGATLVKVDGTPSECFRLVKEVSSEFDWANLTTTFLNPFATEGDKTLAYELYEQVRDINRVWIVIPVGAGPLLFGCYKGFEELKELGLVSSLPSMVGVQAEGCAPIVRAFEKQDQEVKAWDTCQTIASGIADSLAGYAQDGTLTLQTIRESGGLAVSVSDEALLESVLILGRDAGIFAEPTGAASIAAVKKLVKEGLIKKDDTVICVITGQGFKDLEPLKKKIKITEKEIKPELKEVEKILGF